MTLYRAIDVLAWAAMLAMALVAFRALYLGDLLSAALVLVAVTLVAFTWARWAEL